MSKEHYDLAFNETQRHKEDSEVSYLSHFNAAGVFERRHRVLVGVATGMSIFLTWLLTSPFDKFIPIGYSSILNSSLPIFLSLLVSLFTGIGAWLNFNDLAIQHRMTAHNYRSLHRNCLNWKTDFPDESMVKEAVQATKQYRDRLSEINRNSPHLPKWAWRSVEKQRAEGSTNYIVDS